MDSNDGRVRFTKLVFNGKFSFIALVVIRNIKCLRPQLLTEIPHNYKSSIVTLGLIASWSC